MRRFARFGLGAGILAGLGAATVPLRRTVQRRRDDRRARAADARRNMWPPVPVKPGASAKIDAERVREEGGAAG
jgi:hypothetical protein